MLPQLAGYSLWLIPAEPARSHFQEIINDFSVNQGTLTFSPHVTLIAGVEPAGGADEVLRVSHRLADELHAFSARVKGAAHNTLYFQSVSYEEQCPKSRSF